MNAHSKRYCISPVSRSCVGFRRNEQLAYFNVPIDGGSVKRGAFANRTENQKVNFRNTRRGRDAIQFVSRVDISRAEHQEFAHFNVTMIGSHVQGSALPDRKESQELRFQTTRGCRGVQLHLPSRWLAQPASTVK